jgi:hypothetical protein
LGDRSLDLFVAAQPQTPVRGVQAAAQIGLYDPDDLVDFVIRHFRLAEAVDEGGALKRIDEWPPVSAFSMRPARVIAARRTLRA